MANNTGLPALPKLPTKGGTPRDCSCGCGARTKGGRWVPGHDAILLAWVLRAERGTIAAIPEPHTAAGAALMAEREANGTTGRTHGAGKQLAGIAPLTGKARKAAKRAARKTERESAPTTGQDEAAA